MGDRTEVSSRRERECAFCCVAEKLSMQSVQQKIDLPYEEGVSRRCAQRSEQKV